MEMMKTTVRSVPDGSDNNWATIDSNGQQSAVLHASVMPFFYDIENTCLWCVGWCSWNFSCCILMK